MWVSPVLGCSLNFSRTAGSFFWKKTGIKEPEPTRNLESKKCQSRGSFQNSERVDGFHQITNQRAGGCLVSSFNFEFVFF
jgi:hypothetical protein